MAGSPVGLKADRDVSENASRKGDRARRNQELFKLLRSIFPRSFFGSDEANSIRRGYLYAARRVLTNVFKLSAVSSFCAKPSRNTTNAFGFTNPSADSSPITAHSSTDACCKRQFSISDG